MTRRTYCGGTRTSRRERSRFLAAVRPAEPDRRRERETEPVERARGIAADDRKSPSRIEQDAVLALCEIRIRAAPCRLDRTGDRLDTERRCPVQPRGRKVRRPDVELDVAEAVEVDHLAGDLPRLDLRLRERHHGERARVELVAELFDRRPRREVGG